LKHGTNIVNRGPKSAIFWPFLLFFGLLFRPLPLEEANSAIFWYFLLIFSRFYRCPLPSGKFSANALGLSGGIL